MQFKILRCCEFESTKYVTGSEQKTLYSTTVGCMIVDPEVFLSCPGNLGLLVFIYIVYPDAMEEESSIDLILSRGKPLIIKKWIYSHTIYKDSENGRIVTNENNGFIVGFLLSIMWSRHGW